MAQPTKGRLYLAVALITVVTAGGAYWWASDSPPVSLAQAPAQAEARETTYTATAAVPSAVPTSPADAPGTESPVSADGTVKRGPGAVFEFDPETAPLTGAITATEYVTSYYDRVVAGDLEGAWAMLPKDEDASSLADYVVLLSGYEPAGYFVTDAVDFPGGHTVTVLQFGEDNSSFNTTWTFLDVPRGRVLKDVTYALPSGGACH